MALTGGTSSSMVTELFLNSCDPPFCLILVAITTSAIFIPLPVPTVFFIAPQKAISTASVCWAQIHRQSRNWLFLFLRPYSPSPKQQAPHFYQLFCLGIQISVYVCVETPILTYLCAAQNLLCTRTGWRSPGSEHRQLRSGLRGSGFTDTLAAAAPLILLSA